MTRAFRLRFAAAALVALAVLPAMASAEPLQPIPPLKARVTDLAGALNVREREDLEAKLAGGDVYAAVTEVVTGVWAENKQVVFGGDGYSDEWHQEAERRGLANLRTTPDALPSVVSESTVKVFGDYGVLSERELHYRYEVWCEQYASKLNIEGEMTATIARTIISG